MAIAAAQAGLAASRPLRDLGVLPSVLDGGLGHRAAIGLVVLAIDQTLEHEFRQLVRIEGVAFYESRVPCGYQITPETLRAIGAHIGPGVDLILPGQKLDVVAFCCTSATMLLGEESVFAEIRRRRPDAACTTPVTAALAGLRALGARRIGLLTPYAPQINENLIAYLAHRGIEIGAVATFDRPDDREAARIALANVADGIARLAAQDGIDAVFVSCTSLRVCAAIAELEAGTGIAVTSSNHALAWHCLRLAGVPDIVPGAGRLFTLPAA